MPSIDIGVAHDLTCAGYYPHDTLPILVRVHISGKNGNRTFEISWLPKGETPAKPIRSVPFFAWWTNPIMKDAVTVILANSLPHKEFDYGKPKTFCVDAKGRVVRPPKRRSR